MTRKITTILLVIGGILLFIELYQIKKISDSPKQEVLLIDKKFPDKHYYEITYIPTDKLDTTTKVIEIDFQHTIKERIPFYLWNKIEKGKVSYIRKADGNDQYIFGDLSSKRILHLILISWEGRVFLITLIIFTLNIKSFNQQSELTNGSN